MTALRLLNTESQDKADYLHNQLITDINVPSTYWECAESYLKGVGIYDVFLIKSFCVKQGTLQRNRYLSELGSCEI